ncbi:Thioesterase/thiol ester dehydrase-isomerase [Trametopsis cervina]|nr:Thioesterase/thiol ester dehydrase-isomerase [Trametopsis cervina]
MLSGLLRRQLTRSRTASGHRLASTAPTTPRTLGSSLRQLAILSSVGVAAYGVGALYPPSIVTYLTPRIAPPPPDPDHPQTLAYVEDLEAQLQQLPLVQKLRSSPDAREWYEARPYTSVPKEQLVNTLTAGSLRGAGKLALPPLVRAKKDESEAIIVIHVGTAVCGHEGIVHGGMLATLIDESFGRITILNLQEAVVTANLTLNYRAPTHANQFLVLKTRVDEKQGRKVKVSGSIETLEGQVLVEANALFIKPRYSTLLNREQLYNRLGRPSEPLVDGPLATNPAIPPAMKTPGP